MFSIAYMIHYPTLQADIKREIGSVLIEKNDDFVLVSHRPSLPLTEATVNEVLRIGNVGAVTPPRLLKVKLERGKVEDQTMICPLLAGIFPSR